MLTLLALATVVATPLNSDSSPDAIDKVCGYAVEVAFLPETGGDTARYERYLGRMEKKMNDLGLSDKDRVAVRISCDIYLRGGARALNLLGQSVRATPSK